MVFLGTVRYIKVLNKRLYNNFLLDGVKIGFTYHPYQSHTQCKLHYLNLTRIHFSLLILISFNWVFKSFKLIQVFHPILLKICH